jgi:hypothetical protein
MTAEYCTVEELSAFLQEKLDDEVALSADAASGQKVVPVTDTRRYVVGMTVRLWDNDTLSGEVGTIASIQAGTSITLAVNLGSTYTAAQDARVQIQCSFTATTRPSWTNIESFIEQVQEEIDSFCLTSWLSAGRVATDEYHDYYPMSDQFGRLRDWTDRGKIYSRFRPIKSLTHATSDKLEVWDGSQYVDYLNSSKFEGRDKDYWAEYDRGVIHFSNSYPYRIHRSVRLTYHYGHSSIPYDIKAACLNLVGAKLLLFEDHAVHLAEGAAGIPHPQKSEIMEKKAWKLLERHQETYIHG